ncbi:MAG TPA: class I SAM-dependent methyltransferase [Aquabacterium sp.]|nr:class I SAM-dependent methyltransferase [Aquabacterium sp.]
MHHTARREAFVEETRFGNWFLKSDTWKEHVLDQALQSLQAMIPAGHKLDRILDVGCGFGRSFNELARRFAPSQIIGMDADPRLQQRAGDRARACSVPVTLQFGNAAQLPLPDEHVDMVFCHQTFHHIVAQEEALAEFFRVLKPGGLLLFAESTRKYIHSLPIRLLFRHPMDVQRTADEYAAMIRQAGFDLPAERIALPYLWWSRSDLGLMEVLGVRPRADREETLINAVAIKP